MPLPPDRFPYELESRWRVPGKIDAVYDVLTDAEALPHWWPDAYYRVREVARGDAQGRGRIADIVTRGKLPYEISWRLELLEAEKPNRILVRASGELVGYGEWRLRQDGETVELDYTWHVRAEKPWMKRIEFLLKPVFALNHQWVMRRGEQGMVEELARRARN
jgi:uncharacterized protein YndB with AHSA1/START domain